MDIWACVIIFCIFQNFPEVIQRLMAKKLLKLFNKQNCKSLDKPRYYFVQN